MKNSWDALFSFARNVPLSAKQDDGLEELLLVLRKAVYSTLSQLSHQFSIKTLILN